MIGGEYVKHYRQSMYFPIWQNIRKYIRQIKEPRILEIGCGTGQLAHFLYDEGFRNYRGFDIDAEALEIAKANSPQAFFQGDAKDPKNYLEEENIIIATEVLEHIEDDLAILSLLKKGVNFLFSVPTFNCAGHLRWFDSAPEVASHYFEKIYIKNLIRLRHPSKWFIGWGVIR